MASYSAPRTGFTPQATDTDLSVTSSGTTIDRVTEVFIGGEATASTVNQMQFRRHSAVGVTPTAITLVKLNNRSASAGATAASAFSTDPTLGGILLNLAFNAFGGVIRWVAAPGEELYLVGGTAADTEAGLNSATGTGQVSAHVIFEEL